MTISNNHKVPLAERLRPQAYEFLVGQQHLLDLQKPLGQALTAAQPHSMILWGPPGSGKTTIAYLFAKNSSIAFEALSAVNSGLKEVRAVITQAQINQQEHNKRTVLFIDEIHRFNKAQQDIFLPFVEKGTIILIGATTENPSFEINRALLSRCQIYILKPLEQADLSQLLVRAIDLLEIDLKPNPIYLEPTLQKQLIQISNGDGRYLLNLLERLLAIAPLENQCLHLDSHLLEQVLNQPLAAFDKGGDLFYEQISALHKSVRGSNPDAALYWFARMLAGGCDPLYIARRLVRMATEDIGNADPNALGIALNAWTTQERLGSPEGELALAQVVIYLAVAPKSNAAYNAWKKAQADALHWQAEPVPIHLRNAPTSLMKELDYGKEYRYDHDEPHAYAIGQRYFPDKMLDRVYYVPTDRGLEIKIAQKLAFLKSLTAQTTPEKQN